MTASTWESVWNANRTGAIMPLHSVFCLSWWRITYTERNSMLYKISAVLPLSLSVHLFWKRKEREKQFIRIHVYAPCSILDKCCVNAITTFTDWLKNQLTTKINCLQTITGIKLWEAFRTTGTLCKPLIQKSYTWNNVITDKRMQTIASGN